jgi:single-stranded-DNA-specific exonuclease
MTRGVEVCERKTISVGARFRFRQGGRFIGGVAFGVNEQFCSGSAATVDLVYRLNENEWNGNSNLELKLVDARPAQA